MLARHARLLALPLLLGAIVGGCGKRDPRPDAASAMKSPPPEVEATASAPPPLPPPAQRALLIAAAGRFEDLTERAFAGDAIGNETRRAAAVAAAAQVRALLTPDEQGLLDAALVQVATGTREHRLSELALGAAEAFRTILGAAGGEGVLPIEIGLLDYAGFRITALNHDPAPRWEDIAKTVLFANQQWTAVKPRITDAAAANTFDHVLTALLEASAARHQALVAKAAQQELDLVDVLEKSVRPAPPA